MQKPNSIYKKTNFAQCLPKGSPLSSRRRLYLRVYANVIASFFDGNNSRRSSIGIGDSWAMTAFSTIDVTTVSANLISKFN